MSLFQMLIDREHSTTSTSDMLPALGFTFKRGRYEIKLEAFIKQPRKIRCWRFLNTKFIIQIHISNNLIPTWYMIFVLQFFVGQSFFQMVVKNVF